MTSVSDRAKIFTNDPVKLHSMVHCRVTVTSTDLKEHTGWVHTIDPVSESVVLVEFGVGGKHEVIIVSGYNVENIKVIDSSPPPGLASDIDSIFRKEQVQYSSQELKARRESLCVWLSDNRVPYTVKEDMSIQVLTAAVISKPYKPESVQCTNEVVLGKVMDLVRHMPAPSNTMGKDNMSM
ncbi:gem-associated protein 6 [Procambarus clarkii]|uniref:gem-associated protein 6 n=1 Tax=Procambarus clarkii TaxID=6728 RepID=UPI001E671305|nr:gem-associated protein 6-like isoform X2 [Procambarus clarkii]